LPISHGAFISSPFSKRNIDIAGCFCCVISASELAFKNHTNIRSIHLSCLSWITKNNWKLIFECFTFFKRRIIIETIWKKVTFKNLKPWRFYVNSKNLLPIIIELIISELFSWKTKIFKKFNILFILTQNKPNGFEELINRSKHYISDCILFEWSLVSNPVMFLSNLYPESGKKRHRYELLI
jgi:hypothetical protein